MSGAKSSRRHYDRQVTGDTLRRLIEEGAPQARDTTEGAQPSEAALRDLAAALNIAAGATPSPGEKQAAHEAAAVTAFRDARPQTASGARVHRRALREHLHRARTAVLGSVLVAVLGGSVAAAAAGGGVPFVGDDRPAPPSASAPEEPGATPPGAPAAPVGQARPTPSSASGQVGHGAGSAAGTGVAASGAPGGTGPTDAAAAEAAPQADEAALRSLCTAHARNPHLAPRALVTAAGGSDRVNAYCQGLLATPSDHVATGPAPGASGERSGTGDGRANGTASPKGGPKGEEPGKRS
jgi:hypothetical protein